MGTGLLSTGETGATDTYGTHQRQLALLVSGLWRRHPFVCPARSGGGPGQLMTAFEARPDQGAKTGTTVALGLPNSQVADPPALLCPTSSGPKRLGVAEGASQGPQGGQKAPSRSGVKECPERLSEGEQHGHRSDQHQPGRAVTGPQNSQPLLVSRPLALRASGYGDGFACWPIAWRGRWAPFVVAVGPVSPFVVAVGPVSPFVVALGSASTPFIPGLGPSLAWSSPADQCLARRSTPRLTQSSTCPTPHPPQ